MKKNILTSLAKKRILALLLAWVLIFKPLFLTVGLIYAADDSDTPETQETQDTINIIETDDAASTSDSETETNTNITQTSADSTQEDSDQTPPEPIDEEPQPEPSPEPLSQELTATESAYLAAEDTSEPNACFQVASVENTNQAAVVSESQASANTGDNNQNNAQGDAQMTTGNAQASATNLNLVNTNITDSNVNFLLLDVHSEEASLNLYQQWQESTDNQENNLEVADGVGTNFLDVKNTNSAVVTALTTASANTGDNNQNNAQGDAQMTTGNAQATANSVSLVNTNLTSSNLLAGVINIFGNFVGNIILPTPHHFEPQEPQEPTISSVTNINSAQVTNSSTALANTGNNNQNNSQGNTSLNTGNSQSISNAYTMVNTNITSGFFYHILVNSFGGWMGHILGWSSPNSSTLASEGSLDFSTQSSPPEPSNTITSVQNENSAVVTALTTASANTGDNNQNNTQGDAQMTTGNARAIANSTTIVNTNITGSNLLFGMINVLGTWTGDLIFAYPDLSINLTSSQEEVSPGDELSYTVTVTNQGFADAHDILVQNSDPNGLVYQTSSNNPIFNEASVRRWSVNNLAPGESSSFQVNFQVDPNISPETKEVTYTVSVNSPEEEDLNNNSASETVKVVFAGQEDGNSGQDGNDNQDEDVKLSLSSWNNAGEYVFPGDTVIFELTVENTGSADAHDAKISSLLFNEVPYPIGGGNIELGTIYAHEKVTVVFEITLDVTGEVGLHHLSSQVEAKNAAGDTVSSNESNSDFFVKGFEALSSLIPEAQATETSTDQAGEKVLGEADFSCPEYKKDWWPYLLALCIAILWGIDRIKRRQKSKQKSK